jgi:hypothetical protein
VKLLRLASTVVFLLGAGSWASAQTLTAPLPATLESVAENSQPVAEPRSRPRVLVPLYVLQFTLNGLDVHSTVRALDAGHREANPLFKDGSAKRMIGAKVASSAVSVFVAEKLWKKNRVAAVVMMAGVNAGLAAVVANNYRVGGIPGRR